MGKADFINQKEEKNNESVSFSWVNITFDTMGGYEAPNLGCKGLVFIPTPTRATGKPQTKKAFFVKGLSISKGSTFDILKKCAVIYMVFMRYQKQLDDLYGENIFGFSKSETTSEEARVIGNSTIATPVNNDGEMLKPFSISFLDEMGRTMKFSSVFKVKAGGAIYTYYISRSHSETDETLQAEAMVKYCETILKNHSIKRGFLSCRPDHRFI